MAVVCLASALLGGCGIVVQDCVFVLYALVIGLVITKITSTIESYSWRDCLIVGVGGAVVWDFEVFSLFG